MMQSKQIIASLFLNKFRLVQNMCKLFHAIEQNQAKSLHHYFQLSLNLFKTRVNLFKG